MNLNTKNFYLKMNAFRDLHENLESDHEEERLVDNFRTVQPLNDRAVYSSFDNTSRLYMFSDYNKHYLTNVFSLKLAMINVINPFPSYIFTKNIT